MARKPETLASERVNKKLAGVYFEKMHNPYRGGTPDFYYEGFLDMMWVEYKWYDRKPKQWEMDKKLTRLQQNWLRRAAENGRKTAVIAGYPGGYAIFENDGWIGDVPDKEDLSAQDVAKWIEFKVT